jgi:hypothetical protein
MVACSDGGPDAAGTLSLSSAPPQVDDTTTTPSSSSMPPPPPPGGPEVQYFGGLVVHKPEIWPVAWTSNVGYLADLEPFYQALTESRYLRWLHEYDTPSQHIRPAHFEGVLVDDAAPVPAELSDGDIQNELWQRLGGAGWPVASDDTILVVHLPPGITVTSGSGRSCVNFCGYHSAFQRHGKRVRYAVVPDFSGCSGPCGGMSAADDALAVTSHETAETITDPDFQASDPTGSATAWLDPVYGEIADICAFQTTKVRGFTMQLLWSNAANSCIARPPRGAEGQDDDASP